MKMDADRGGPHPAGPGALAAAPTGRKGRRGRLLWVAPRWSAWRVLAWQVGIVVVGIASWQLAAQTHVIDPFFWSYPSKILDTFTTFVTTGKAYTDIWFTFRATLLGFVYGTLAGALIGLSFWWSQNYARVAQPFLICFEATPKLALAPLIVLVFGIGLASKVALGIALTLVVTVLTTFTAVRAVDPDSERLLYSLGATRWQVFCKLVVPSVLPWIISSLRVKTSDPLRRGDLRHCLDLGCGLHSGIAVDRHVCGCRLDREPTA